ncbi:hypothetical protein MW7_007015 [Imbroritus primus]|uniref:Uncharacterized protein n=1 Tax=Imbroritus primus TaxID=3058603 RepID=A0ACD3SQE5_9BURK|nr:hypothetical protein MW7_007015 [Burkholderiaceae bacterium PBA]
MMQFKSSSRTWLGGICMLAGWLVPLHAGAMDAGHPHNVVQGWHKVSIERLDTMRGGFVTPQGLHVAFGIERAIYVNGELVASVNISIPDLGRITQEQARALANVNTTMNLVQNGPANTFQPALENPLTVGTVIQNTLNNQQISSLLRIDAIVNTLEGFKNMHAQTALSQALANVTGGR